VENSDPEIAVVVHFTAKPGKEEELLTWLKGLPGPTRKEPGCIRYELNQEIENKAAFTFAEKFVNNAAFEAHVKMPYSVRFSEHLDELVQSKQIRLHRELLPLPHKETASENGSKDAVIVIAHFTSKPGKEKELQDFLQSLVAPTRSEPGCARYEVNQDLNDPSTFTFVETFANQAGFDAHCATPYVARLFELLPILVQEKYIGLHKRVSE
jgi:quinol monooxygenase YgiN